MCFPPAAQAQGNTCLMIRKVSKPAPLPASRHSRRPTAAAERLRTECGGGARVGRAEAPVFSHRGFLSVQPRPLATRDFANCTKMPATYAFHFPWVKLEFGTPGRRGHTRREKRLPSTQYRVPE